MEIVKAEAYALACAEAAESEVYASRSGAYAGTEEEAAHAYRDAYAQAHARFSADAALVATVARRAAVAARLARADALTAEAEAEAAEAEAWAQRAQAEADAVWSER